MNVRQMLSNTPRGITVEMKAAAIDRIGRILDDASQDPEKFIRIVRTQLGRDERALFTYGHVCHRASQGDTGAMALLAEFIRQERNDTLTPEEVSDEQLELLWKAGVSIGRVLSSDCQKLAAWYQGHHREGSKAYSVVTHWAKALRICRMMKLESVVFTLEDLLATYAERYVPRLPGDDISTEAGLVALYEDYHPGFAEAFGPVQQTV